MNRYLVKKIYYMYPSGEAPSGEIEGTYTLAQKQDLIQWLHFILPFDNVDSSFREPNPRLVLPLL
jgi:hypothetical protein